MTNWRSNMAKKQGYPPVGKTKTETGLSGKDVCGACGGEIVEVSSNGRRACSKSKCGKEAQ